MQPPFCHTVRPFREVFACGAQAMPSPKKCQLWKLIGRRETLPLARGCGRFPKLRPPPLPVLVVSGSHKKNTIQASFVQERPEATCRSCTPPSLCDHPCLLSKWSTSQTLGGFLSASLQSSPKQVPPINHTWATSG